jgi:hypothetical protein
MRRYPLTTPPEHGAHSETAQFDGHEVTLAVVRV